MSTSHKRSRNGCQSCRFRRRKCDGIRPICSGCAKKNVTCVWGIKALFHPSRSLVLSSADQQALDKIERKRRKIEGEGNRSSPALIIDNTHEIVLTYQKSSNDADNNSHEGISEDDDHDTDVAEQILLSRNSADFGDLSSHIEQDILDPHASEATAVQSPGESLDQIVDANDQTLTNESTVDLARLDLPADLDYIFDDNFENNLFGSVASADSFTPPFSLGLEVARKSSPVHEPDFPLEEVQTLSLVRSFLAETAIWCETTDTSKQISVVHAHSLFEHKIYKAAALSLACRQLSVSGVPVEDVSLQLYQYTIKLLIQQNPNHIDAFILAACMLLCVYEMMASHVSDWRRHLKGCAGLFSSKKWNGSSPGLVKTCFWAFARIDTWAAFILQKRTLIPTSRWMTHESLETAALQECPDDYCNLSILNFARVVNCLSQDQHNSAPAESDARSQQLWNFFQQWWHLRPKRVCELYRTEPTNTNPFPSVVFTYPAAICGTTFYHAGCLLLLTRLGIEDRATSTENIHDTIWHASEICGISISNNDHGNWVNHLQPLYIAGQAFGPGGGRNNKVDLNPSTSFDNNSGVLFRTSGLSGNGARSRFDPFDNGISDQSHSRFASEQIALLKHLIRIQRETGWKTDSRAQELRVLWGLQ